MCNSRFVAAKSRAKQSAGHAHRFTNGQVAGVVALSLLRATTLYNVVFAVILWHFTHDGIEKLRRAAAQPVHLPIGNNSVQ